MLNQPLDTQIESLRSILGKSQPIMSALKAAAELNAPNWYLGAGCISQTVWNYLHDYDIDANIKDYDLVYYDEDVSKSAEQIYTQMAEQLFHDLPIRVEVVNQARVHEWYEEDFGVKIPPYISVEDGINSWPTTVTCVAVRKTSDKFVVYAPYGLNDLFGMILRPNKTLITRERYEQKVELWVKVWPKLTVVEW